MAYPPITSLGTVPQRTQTPAEFATNADSLLGALPNFRTELNAFGAYVDAAGASIDSTIGAAVADATAASAASAVAASGSASAAATSASAASGSATASASSAASALAYKDLAASNANFKGLWSSLTGALNVPAMVYHNGLYWNLTANLANVTTAQPGSSASWVVANGDSFRQMVDGILSGATLDLNFAGNSHKSYEDFGLEPKQLTKIVTAIRGTTATYNSPFGIRTSATNTPRIAYSAVNGQAIGVMSEEQCTNLALQSKDFTTAWTQSPDASVNVTSNAATAPDGTLTADKFIEADTADTYHDLFQAHTFLAATRYTLSMFVKAAERTKGTLVFGAQTGFTSERAVQFDLSAKTAVAIGSGVTVGIEEHQNGWSLVWVSATTDAAGVSPFYVRLQDASGGSIYAGTVGYGFFISDAQLEVGSFPTSRITTTTAAVTRNADQINATVPVTTEGTIICIAVGNEGSNSTTQAVFVLSDGTYNNRIMVRRNHLGGGTNYVVSSSNVVQATANSTVKAAGRRNKFAISWKANQFIGAEDGVVVLNDTSGSIPVNATQLGIGSFGAGQAGAESLNGTVERIVFIPRALTAAELQAVTA